MSTSIDEPNRTQIDAASVAIAPSPVSTVGRSEHGLRFRLRTSGIEAVLRLAGFVIVEGARHLAAALFDPFRPGERAAARREARRARAAARLAALLGSLKGPFVKAGQFAAVRYDVIPPAAREAFASLQDRVPALPFGAIRDVIESELGRPLDAVFARLDPAPLGAASIAQVHRGLLLDGRDVAVKVQHPWLAAALPADLRLLRALLRGWLRVAAWRGRPSRVDGTRLFDEFAAGLADELDFRREAAIAREIAANLASEAQIVVPEPVDALTTRRVLVMTYHAALPILDRERLVARGVPVREVLEVLARAYARQVFVDGLFHADPHPGNLFVIDEASASSRPRVLFVDFGLSKRLSPALRAEMRQAIYALLQRDDARFLASMQRMDMIAPGAEAAVQSAVRGMFERLAAQAGGPLSMSGAQVLGIKDEAKRLLQETPGLQLPNDLLLYARTLSYLFALGERLDPGVDLMKISVPYLLRFLAAKD